MPSSKSRRAHWWSASSAHRTSGGLGPRGGVLCLLQEPRVCTEASPVTVNNGVPSLACLAHPTLWAHTGYLKPEWLLGELPLASSGGSSPDTCWAPNRAWDRLRFSSFLIPEVYFVS